MDKICYTVDFGKRKNFYISISKGKIIIKAPLNAKQSEIEAIVKSKKDWIQKTVEKTLKNIKPEKKFIEGGEFYILGKKHILHKNFYDDKKIFIQKTESLLNVFIPKKIKDKITDKDIEKVFQKWYNEFSKNEIMESFERLQKITGISVNKITIKKMTKSWGRCSSLGNISINRAIVEYDKKAIDYVVLHELCHIIHFNHSKNFWKLVETYMPDYMIWRNEIK